MILSNVSTVMMFMYIVEECGFACENRERASDLHWVRAERRRETTETDYHFKIRLVKVFIHRGEKQARCKSKRRVELEERKKLCELTTAA